MKPAIAVALRRREGRLAFAFSSFLFPFFGAASGRRFYRTATGVVTNIYAWTVVLDFGTCKPTKNESFGGLFILFLILCGRLANCCLS